MMFGFFVYGPPATISFFVRHKTESEENAYICLHNNLMNMAKKLLTALFLSILAINVFAQSPSGSWEGTLEAGANKLRLVFNFDKDANGNTICSMDSPDQGAKGIPANASIADNGEITVSIPALGVTYEATMKNGLITGRFKQSGYSFDLTLHPGKSEVRRPQNPQPPYPYTTEEVSFTNRDGNAVLHGTLTLPESFGTKGTTPVVLMVTGSGQQNRDEEVFGHKPFMVIADYLARNGIASLRYDDRGVGESTGDAANATTLDNMEDALAGLRFLKGRSGFGKTGILGHSEGGTIAFMIGGRHPEAVDFIVSLAGSAVRGDMLLVEQNRQTLSASGVPQAMCDDYCRLLAAVFTYKIENGTPADAANTVDSLASATGAMLPAEAKQNAAKVLETSVPWLDFFMAYDPHEDTTRIQCPVMAINGSRDTQVAADMNLGALRKSLPANGKTTIREYDGLNHLFQHCTTGSPTEYAQIEETFSPEVLHDIAVWINGL